jgi:hypothetical protein
VAFAAIDNTATNATGFFICKVPGTGMIWGACTGSDTDCGANLVCDSAHMWCSPICDMTHMCTQPPGGLADGGMISCVAFTNLTSGQGTCSTP